MASSVDALEALLQFRQGVLKKKTASPVESNSIRPSMPVPNPLDPTQPHVIEGDSPSPGLNRISFASGVRSVPSKPNMAPIATTVPNPLATPLAHKHPTDHRFPAPVSSVYPSTATNKILNHGFIFNRPVPMPTTSSYSTPRTATEVEVRPEKISDALNSKPQRGKKRKNLRESERLVLTRTRNREHAKSTRMKKKARLEELIEMEKKYLLLKEKELLNRTRRDHLVQFVEAVGNKTVRNERNDCIYSSRLIKLASQEITSPDFSATDNVALTTVNSGLVKVSVHGTDLETGNSKTLSGVVCVDFTPGNADICSVFLYLSSPNSPPSSVGISPSVSVLSFSLETSESKL
mmetsp:Transcript_50401/g.107337  ORF Transcript_50401/g.107337 Transcript_50401/m.107337 type:complete len:349 (+) Transcript_50401:138-1184(+)|eukprot:CAMPEP_0172533720 /NCGR_PEP_ID=MMETSP1067-20121228/6321_1 /TAXON_ID=265564 ORGANISM="Thalassiosira punctigera, Strain Tpunct2005C2" /NCGR_SAMPLE_ID=MMETSP1067 /ASSEMBLY_ACC=CAM_ASM_000444 /LENGTH=348 /DNA_ID=CAMNT_0013318393 /DNA_START=114 /DNA_END=1160 /DNA_ORIENTATION=+